MVIPRGLLVPLEVATARAVAMLPGPVARLLAGRPIRIDGQELHPQVRIALRLERLTGGSQILPLAEARERRRHEARVFSGRQIEVARTAELELPGPAGPIAARLYVPAGAAGPTPGASPGAPAGGPARVPAGAAPLVVYFHGGGHVMGDLGTHDQPCRLLAREIPALVLAIDYRLAPEHPFPAAVEDALAAFRWARGEAARLAADPARIAVAGDSAGGNLAAAVCQLALAGGEPAPAMQALVYPVLDYSAERRSYELFGEGFFLTREEMAWYRGHYLARAADSSDPRASPILAPDLAGLPPAHVVTAGFDPLRDEGEEYARRLAAAGVPTTLRREPDLVHGFVNAAGLGGRAREATAAIAAAIRAGLGGERVAHGQ